MTSKAKTAGRDCLFGEKRGLGSKQGHRVGTGCGTFKTDCKNKKRGVPVPTKKKNPSRKKEKKQPTMSDSRNFFSRYWTNARV